MKLIKTSNLFQTNYSYVIGGNVFVLDISSQQLCLKTERPDVVFQNNVNNDGSMLIGVMGLEHSCTFTLQAESKQDIKTLLWHRVIDWDDPSNIKIIFVHMANVAALCSEDHGRFLERTDIQANEIAVKLGIGD